MYLTLNLFEASQRLLRYLVRLIVIDQKSNNAAYQMGHEKDKHGIIYNFNLALISIILFMTLPSCLSKPLFAFLANHET